MIMKYDKDTMNSLQEAYKSISEGDDHEGKKLGDVEKEKYKEKLKKASKKAPTPKNKIVSFNKESYGKRIEEAIKMSKKEYAKTHKDFKSDDPKNPRVTRYVPGKGTVSTPVELEQVDKKKEMEDKMKEVEDMRSLPTRMNLIKTKLRAMGLNMSHQLKGKELSEVIDYTLTERTRYQKEMGIGKGGTAKNDLAFQKVMRDHQDERMGANQKKKKRGAKTDEGTGKFTKMLTRKRQQQAANKAFAARAKAAGETPQQRADRAAIYGSEENMEKGIGSGS